MSVMRLATAGLPPSTLGTASPCQAHCCRHLPTSERFQRCQEGNSTCGLKESARVGCRLNTHSMCFQRLSC